MKIIIEEIDHVFNDADYGHFIDIDYYDNQFKKKHELKGQYASYEKTKLDENENYYSFKRIMFSINSVCCVTAFILILNTCLPPRK